MILEYFRPVHLTEALDLLNRAIPLTIPLGGGTFISRQEKRDCALVDLQSLGLDTIQQDPDWIRIGAAVRLEQIFQDPGIPEALREAVRHEAGLNMRQMMTLGGGLTTADGNSPLAVTLLGMGARLKLEPSNLELPLEQWFSMRGAGMHGKLVTEISIPRPGSSACDWVSRTSFDRPIVWITLGKNPLGEISLAVNHVGSQPVVIHGSGEPGSIAEKVLAAYRDYTDSLASAEYRGSIARLLALRLLSRFME